MGKKLELNQKEREKVEAVLQILRKQSPLTLKQEKFCNYACVERFLKAKGESVKKAAKQLRACLSWRDSIGTENLIADEFSEESASAFMNILLSTLKVMADYYPGRLHKAFVIDPPSLFSYLWKGVRPFVELSTITMTVCSLGFEENLDFSDFVSDPRASSLRFDTSSISSTAKIGSCASSRFSFTVSHHFDSLKPWYLSFADMSASKVGPTGPSPSILGPQLISPLNARSLSFASPIERTPRGSINGGRSSKPVRKSFFPSTPLPQRTQSIEVGHVRHPRTPKPSFLQSPATFFKKESHINKPDKGRESFAPYLKFYRRPYDEMIYRSKMRPPLGGLTSIVSPQLRRRHVSVSQRF
ncbi:CRAL-TRIO lipid binding domain [Dillenia turbinata]|uniref:CRAL-TRIO lipid binding domain n=1 Tax=Dillenia turbinata TaxID=194707 RepID=A0AAN8VLQ8_9MAGN